MSRTGPDPDREPPSEGETGSEREASDEEKLHEGGVDIKEGPPGVSGEEIQRQAHEHDPAEKGFEGEKDKKS
jgi:hypothetical protein